MANDALVTQVLVEVLGVGPDSFAHARASQAVIEVLGPYVNVRSSQSTVEVLGKSRLGNARVSQVAIEVLIWQPIPKNLEVTGRGRPSSLRFGLNGWVEVQGLSPTVQFQPVVPVDPALVVFRPTGARLAARYSGSQIVDLQDGRPSFIAPWNAVKITTDPTDRLYVVSAGEEGRLDIIAWNVYRREDLWFAIAQANDIVNIFTEPFAGDQIRIPSISRVLRILGQTSTGNEIQRFNPNA